MHNPQGSAPFIRSIRSIRSIRTLPKSPGNLFPFHLGQRTPSKTPRSASSGAFNNNLMLTVPTSASKRRISPRNAHLHAHFALDDVDHPIVQLQFDSPFTATLNQLLSEANEFTAGSPSHGLEGLELNLGHGHGHHHHHLQDQQQHEMDFGSFLGGPGDLGMGLMPSSPPMLRGARGVEFGGVLMHGGGDGGEMPGWGAHQ